MEDNFNLSNHIQILECNKDKELLSIRMKFIYLEDIKEFIRLLEKEINHKISLEKDCRERAIKLGNPEGLINASNIFMLKDILNKINSFKGTELK